MLSFKTNEGNVAATTQAARPGRTRSIDAALILGDSALQQGDKRGGLGVGQVAVHPGDSSAEEPTVCRLVWEFFLSSGFLVCCPQPALSAR